MSELSLDQINEALAPFSKELAARMNWDILIEEFEQKEKALKQQITALDQQIASERADVDRLERTGIYRFWKTAKGEHEEALAAEYLEWEAALGEREKLAGQLAEIEERLQFLQARKAQLGNIDKPIEDLLYLKRQAFRKAQTNPLDKLETEINQFKLHELGLGGILVPLPGLIYELSRLHKAMEAKALFFEAQKKNIFKTYGATFESIEKRFDSLIRSMDLYHKTADRRLPFHGGYFSNFVGRAKTVELTELVDWLKELLADVKKTDTQAKVLQTQMQIETKAAKQQLQKLLLNL
ncbi:MAG: hypothetical protein AB8H47_03300 [Bacteroidia bacterium]